VGWPPSALQASHLGICRIRCRCIGRYNRDSPHQRRRAHLQGPTFIYTSLTAYDYVVVSPSHVRLSLRRGVPDFPIAPRTSSPTVLFFSVLHNDRCGETWINAALHHEVLVSPVFLDFKVIGVSGRVRAGEAIHDFGVRQGRLAYQRLKQAFHGAFVGATE